LKRDKERRKKKTKKKGKVTNEPHLSVVDPTFDVFTPNRKWDGPIARHPNRKWSYLVPQTRDRTIPPHLVSQPNATLLYL
jgi:hypothetical protein